MRLKLHGLLLILFSIAFINVARSQTQTIDRSCGVNIGSVDKSSDVNVRVDCNSSKQDYISFDYSRLFGAFEVPLLMEFIPGRSAHVVGGGYRVFKDSKGKTEWIREELYQFWRNQLPFKDAIPILTPMWRDISGNEPVAEAIAWKASETTRAERHCFYRSGTIDETGSEFDYLDSNFRFNSKKKCRERDLFDERVGYTFLIIQNNSDEPLTDVQISFRQNYMSRRAVADFKKSYIHKHVISEISRLPEIGNPVEILTRRYGNAQDSELVVSRLAKDFMTISRILPRQKLIALLDVYISNDNSLPASYLYGPYIFDEVQFAVKGLFSIVKVRPPSLEKAARIQVPYGWFAQ